ncbi:hypothetical protein, partial [Klebsiella pneumoniae]|uniref:hypothetical protein n=1 Tax=Klebsiella pneumoniae TaxID=573 RepID=UPI00190FA569
MTMKHPFRSGAQATTLYLHVFDWPADGTLRFDGIGNATSGARVLGAPDRTPAARQDGGAIVVSGLGPTPVDPDCTVVQIDVT